MSKKLALCIFFFLTAFDGFGQNVFYNFPKDYQFYQRDSLGFSEINVFGSVSNENYKAIKLTIHQNGELYFSEKASLMESQSFSWKASLLSGLFEYDFEIKLFLENDSTSVAKASKVLSGDTYLIYGQSNAVAGCCFDMVRKEVDDTFIRNFVFDHFDPSSTNNGWHDLGVEFNWPGVMGSRIAENIIEKNHIPVQIINGAVGGQSLETLVERDSINPENLETYYGLFLKRILGSSSLKPRGFIFSQGEWESDTGVQDAIDSYRQRFNKLISGLKYDGVEPSYFYLIQTNILTRSDGKEAPARLRDIQRQLKKDFPEMRMYAAFGEELSGDGLHYAKPGYEGIADNIYLGIAKDVYGADVGSPVTSPLVQKAVLSKDLQRITLVFDEGQSLRVENVKDFGHYQRRFKDYIYDGDSRVFVDSVKASGNEVELYFSSNIDGDAVTYLPSFFTDDYSNSYNGPLIENELGLPALSFWNYQTCEALPEPKVSMHSFLDERVSLAFEKGFECSSCSYQFFAKAEGAAEYDYLGNQDYVLDTVSVDLPWPKGVKSVSLKLKVVSETCQSDYVDLRISKCSSEGLRDGVFLNIDRLEGSTPVLLEENKLMLSPSKFSKPFSGSQGTGKGSSFSEIEGCVNN